MLYNINNRKYVVFYLYNSVLSVDSDIVSMGSHPPGKPSAN